LLTVQSKVMWSETLFSSLPTNAKIETSTPMIFRVFYINLFEQGWHSRCRDYATG
jgi:hypothetical protein